MWLRTLLKFLENPNSEYHKWTENLQKKTRTWWLKAKTEQFYSRLFWILVQFEKNVTNHTFSGKNASIFQYFNTLEFLCILDRNNFFSISTNSRTLDLLPEIFLSISMRTYGNYFLCWRPTCIIRWLWLKVYQKSL